MQARDATGRKVSLLNDEDNGFFNGPQHHQHHHLSFQSAPLSRPLLSPTMATSSPNTPELLRSDSYDSQISNDPISPLTPSTDYVYSRASLYSKGHDYAIDAPPPKRPAYVDSSRSTSFEDDNSATSPLPERPGKRYPCRYRDSHSCEKTFTTSGHASRHSKIHTAEKAVQCTYAACQKKFTRADNMKQHLETHYKDKSRSSGCQRSHGKAETHRSSVSGRRSSVRDSSQWDMDQQQPLPTPALPSANGTGNAGWNMESPSVSLVSRPAISTTPSSGLDALAMAVACQQRGGSS